MDLSRPMQVVTPTLDGDVLRVLVLADADFSASQVAGMLPDRSQRGIAKVLDRLVAQGIVVQTHVGRPHLYRLNREHLAAEAILSLATQKARLIERLQRALADWTAPPLYAALFGSAARGDHTASSDIDVLIVRPDVADEDAWDSQVAELSATASRWTGNDTRILSFAAAEAQRIARQERVFADVARDGIWLAGDREWLSRTLRKRAS